MHLLEESTQTSMIVLNSAIGEDSIVKTFIAPYTKQLERKMNEVVAFSDIALTKDEPESLLSNFVTDLVFHKGNQYFHKSFNLKADACLLNNGGFRTELPKGNITVGNIFELMPFDNEIYVAKLSGAKVKEMLDFIASKGGMPVAGISMGIKDNTASNVTIGGEKFDVSKEYYILTSDYLYNGGDNVRCFSDALESFPLNIRMRDIIIEYLKELTMEGKNIQAKLDKRIYYE